MGELEDERSEAAARVGTVLAGKFQIVSLLGVGGMGAVYEATNGWTGRRVAIKVLHPEFVKRPEVTQRFMQEARAVTQIGHPNIVDVLDMGEDPSTGALFIVQELLLGEDLRRRIDTAGPMHPAEAVQTLAPIMGALVAAHRRGVIHRDLKPENIFLARTSQGESIPKLIDFGVSKFVDADARGMSVTQTGLAIGTPQYMSPEQARGDTDLDARTDVWSMGAVLYETLSGRALFEAPNYNLLMVRVITEAPPRLELVAPHLPARIIDVVARALSPSKDHRYQSMQEFLGELLEAQPSDASATPSAAPPAEPISTVNEDEVTRVAPPPFRIARGTSQPRTPDGGQGWPTPEAWASPVPASAQSEPSRSPTSSLRLAVAAGVMVVLLGSITFVVVQRTSRPATAITAAVPRVVSAPITPAPTTPVPTGPPPIAAPEPVVVVPPSPIEAPPAPATNARLPAASPPPASAAPRSRPSLPSRTAAPTVPSAPARRSMPTRRVAAPVTPRPPSPLRPLPPLLPLESPTARPARAPRNGAPILD